MTASNVAPTSVDRVGYHSETFLDIALNFLLEKWELLPKTRERLQELSWAARRSNTADRVTLRASDTPAGHPTRPKMRIWGSGTSMSAADLSATTSLMHAYIDGFGFFWLGHHKIAVLSPRPDVMAVM